MDSISLLDRPTLERLSEWGGEALKWKMIALFLESAPQRMAGIRTGLREEDFDQAERAAHSLKSSAGNLGAEALRDLAGRTESLLKAGSREEARTLLGDVETCFSQTIEALEGVREQKDT